MYRTYEPTRDRLVAVKAFRLDVIPEQSQTLADELARAAEAGLFHPSIVEPIAAGVEGTVAYRAEEYVAAESLDVAMRHYAPAALDKALPFITQLAGAIDFARAAGVGHGALHPRDVFVTPDEARATGFGVVEALERVGLRAPVRRPYTAPERIAGGAWSTPADVFSLAAIAYELLTGKRPSGTGEHIGSLEGSQAEEHAGSLQAVLARAMDDDPAKRFPSALGFAAALEAAASTERPADTVRPVPATAAPEPVPARTLAAPVIAELPTEPDEALEPLAPPASPEPEDIALERDEDVAHHALMSEEAAAGQDEPVRRFDEEAGAAFADVRRERFADDFDAPLEARPEPHRLHENSPRLEAPDEEIRDAEPAAVDLAAAEDARAFASVAEEVREQPPAVATARYAAPAAPTIFADAIGDSGRPRSDMLPRATFLIAGLLIGLLAGRFIPGLGRAIPADPAVTTSRPESGGAAPESAQQGKAWSDQQVAQPAKPPVKGSAGSPAPPVPAETPAPSAAAAKPQPKPAAPAATRGTVTVRSTPPGASVTINGRWRGRTPLTLDDLQFGPYTIRVVQSGYAVAREEFTLSSGQPSRTMSVNLRRSSAPPQSDASAARPAPRSTVGVGSIYVDSRPRGARVFVDGRSVGVTPLRLGDVRAGSHTVRLELDDHRTWTDSRYVLSGQETRVTGSLERIR